MIPDVVGLPGQAPGTVFLVGAGPGDPGLITVKGRDVLAGADVVLHDRLIPPELLAVARSDAVRIDVGKERGRAARGQERIHALLVAHARAGRCVVRLKGGDPYVFGRGWEEMEACRAAGVPCVVVPGVTSAIAVPALADVPVTHRRLSRSFAVVTGRSEGAAVLPPHDYAALARIETLVLLMTRSNLREFTARLIEEGRDPATPAAAVADGSTPDQHAVVATLATIADRADEAGLTAPVTTVIGSTAAFAARSRRAAAGRRVRPLAGRRIVLTQAPTSTSVLRDRLAAAGADVVDLPLVEVRYPDSAEEGDRILPQLHSFDWLLFTSVHSVRGFWRRLDTAGRDARALAGVRVATLGPSAAEELRQRGVRADFTSPRPTTHTLLEVLRVQHGLSGRRVLVPRGTAATMDLPAGLTRLGARVTCATVYGTVARVPPRPAVDAALRSAAAIVFASPTAARAFARLSVHADGVALACLGPATAAALTEAGFRADVVPPEGGSPALVGALEQHFAGAAHPAESRDPLADSRR